MTSNANLYASMAERFEAAAGRVALEMAAPPALALDYRGLDRQVAAMAGALRALGVRPGDRVTHQVTKSFASVALYLATVRLGAVYNPLNTSYTAQELAYFIENAEPTLLVAPKEQLEALQPVAARHGCSRLESIEANGSGSLPAIARSAVPVDDIHPSAPDDLAALIYTSGTTGRPKGAMLTHRNLLSNAETLREVWHFGPEDVLLHALPIFHVHGLFVALNTAFLAGAKVLWLERFAVDPVIAALPRATSMMGVPTFYTRLLADPRLDRALCRGMRLFISGSAPLLAETHKAFAERTGHLILERYGMSETGMITSNPYDGERVAGTVGYALPGVEVRIAGEAGETLEAGEVGILEVRGPNVFKGYWRMEEATRESFRADGFFITGDMARMERDGRVTLVGRAKDLIISGGLNVYPVEIEEAINALDGVGESAVIGTPHPDFGEAVVAVITPEGEAPPPSEAEIIAALRPQLAAFKLPKRVFAVPALPRNAMGKVQKAELRTRYADTFRD